MQILVDLFQIEHLGVVIFTNPFGEVLVLGVLRVGERIEEVVETGDASTVLGRAGTAPFEADRIVVLQVGLQNLPFRQV